MRANPRSRSLCGSWDMELGDMYRLGRLQYTVRPTSFALCVLAQSLDDLDGLE